MMAMDAVEAITGTDPYAEDRGRYRTARGALRRLTARGFSGLGDAYGAVFSEVAPAQAQRGDIGLVRLPDEAGRLAEAAVVIVPPHAYGKAETGALRLPLSAVTRAFRVE